MYCIRKPPSQASNATQVNASSMHLCMCKQTDVCVVTDTKKIQKFTYTYVKFTFDMVNMIF